MLIPFAHESMGQQYSNNRFGATLGYGFMIAHRANMRHLIQGHTTSLELQYTIKPKPGHLATYYNNPSIGIQLGYYNPGNQEQIGTCMGVFPSLRFQLWNRKYAPFFQFGAGMGWVEKPFDQLTNYQNIAIGSHINSIVQFSIENNFQWDRASVKVGIGFTHFSNAAFSAPNLGINLPTLYTGLAFGKIRSQYDVDETEKSEEPSRNQRHELFYGMGAREISLHNPKKYLTGSLNYQYFRQFSNVFAWTAGTDLFFNPSLGAELNSSKLLDKANFQWGVCIGAELLFNSSSIYLQQGLYVLSTFKGNGSAYNRLGYRRRFQNGWIINFGLKTHLAVAEYFEIGIGYSFKQKIE